MLFPRDTCLWRDPETTFFEGRILCVDPLSTWQMLNEYLMNGSNQELDVWEMLPPEVYTWQTLVRQGLYYYYYF